MSTTSKFTLGLDIGIASVGWCLLGENRIIDLGVRAFDKAETAKEGNSLNLIRREAKLMRRRLRQRTRRLKKIARVLKRSGLIEDARFFQPQNPIAGSLWVLRAEGLDRKLAREEWARVIYHLCKHRGFHWVSKAEEKKAESDAKGEGGKVKQGLAGTQRLMAEKGYRSIAEMVLAKFPKAQRNKHGEYTKAFSRVLLAEELKKLFERQRHFGNPFASAELEQTILGTGDRKSGFFWEQKPALSGAALLSTLGKCTFEKNEYRAPKASYTAERHVWLTRLNNLRIFIDGSIRPLTESERNIALPLPYLQAGDFTYKQLGDALVKAGLLPKDGFRFAGLAYPTERQKVEGKAKEPESAPLVKLPAWQELRTSLKKAGLEAEWEALSSQAQSGNPALLDQIAFVLSVFKEDDEARQEINKLPLPNPAKTIDCLLGIRFDKFHALSLKSLYRIVPHMEQGKRYDEACLLAGYHHSQLPSPDQGKQKYLPPLYAGRDSSGRMVLADDDGIPRNPVVLRALNQARKVVNAIVRRYGSPNAVHIEMARDLSRPLDERRKIEKEQNEFRARNDKDRAEFAGHFGIVGAPKGGDFEKWRLYREQLGKCPYSGEAIDLARLLEPGYVEIDHALPYSRSFDDSKNNKLLVLSRENRNKGNLTPYEYLGGGSDSPRWQQFVAYVESNKSYRLAKRSRLLRKNFGADDSAEFRERNLYDTRYICKFFKNYVERHLQLAEGSDAQRCVVVSGQMTAFMRARWGLLKVRADGDRHHALDAAVVAASSHAMVKRLADYSRKKELAQVREGFVDIETGEIVHPAMFDKLTKHFPEPWPHFRHELEARLGIDDAGRLREELEWLNTYDETALAEVRPLFVSRATQRRNGGAAHKDTIHAKPERFRNTSSATKKIHLVKLTLADLDDLIDPDRNAKLYQVIRDRLVAHDGKGDKAFPENNPLHKPDRDGNPTGPVVRSVTKVVKKISGIPVRGGMAENGAMLRVDVFSKGGKFYLIPVYVHHRVTGLPNIAIVAHKDETDWTEVDGSFSWCFSLHPNDLIRIGLKNEVHFGYYAGADRSSGTISIWAPDRNRTIGKDGLIRGIGVKTALSLEKFHVDVLGNIYPASPEMRRGLA